jgi:hypothetical protein
VKKGDPVAIRAERSGDGWSSTPESFASGKLAEIVAELSRLEASDIVAESMSEKELEKVGLSPPVTIITALGAAPESAAKAADASSKDDASEALPAPAPRLVELQLGPMTPKGVVARAVGDPIVYRLDLETAERLPVNLEAFESRFKEQAPAADQPPSAPEPDRDRAPSPPSEDSP